MKIPILKLGQLLLTAIQIDLTDSDALDFQQDLLQKVTKTESLGLVIDISALDVVDSFMARILNETAEMVKILGSEVVICGMQPQVAITLVEMGRELIGAETALNLDHGMEKLSELIRGRGKA